MIVILVALTANIPDASAQQIDSHESAPIEYLVAGTVIWADAGSSSVVIRGSDLLGHLHIRVKSYRVKQANALIDLRPGDTITAIFSRRDGMLHRLKRVGTSAGERSR
ncbi:MAG TPA: hypothetical protein VGL82_05930 [Bryobacteraceae bacterium]